MQNKKIYISVVIPCYREEKYIKNTLKDVRKELTKLTPDYEIICVVDGIVDDTFEIVRKIAAKDPLRIKLIGYLKNRGKGFALRLGLTKASGEIIGFIDADGQIDPEAIIRAVTEMRNRNLDIVVGSKALKSSKVAYTPFRSMVSLFSQFYIRSLFLIGVSDTQAGIKFMKKNIVNSVVPSLTLDRFGFDIELLAAAKYVGFNKMGEIPIMVKMLREDNTGPNLVLFIKDVFRTFLELGPVIYRLRTGYYAYKNKAKWIRLNAPQLLTA